MAVSAGLDDGDGVFGEEGEEVAAVGEGVGDDMSRDWSSGFDVGC